MSPHVIVMILPVRLTAKNVRNEYLYALFLVGRFICKRSPIITVHITPTTFPQAIIPCEKIFHFHILGVSEYFRRTGQKIFLIVKPIMINPKAVYAMLMSQFSLPLYIFFFRKVIICTA